MRLHMPPETRLTFLFAEPFIASSKLRPPRLDPLLGERGPSASSAPLDAERRSEEVPLAGVVAMAAGERHGGGTAWRGGGTSTTS